MRVRQPSCGRCISLVRRHVGELGHGVLDDVGHLGVVVVGAVNHFYAILQLTVVAEYLVGPEAEARKAEYLRRNGGQLGRKRHQPVSPQRNVERPDDESL